MNYGMYLSAAGVMNNLYRQDLFANNLANANTVGFKPDLAVSRQRLPERVESTGMVPFVADPQFMLERLGGGQFGGPSRISLKQGGLNETGNDLDVAIRGEGFLVIGDADDPGARLLTRDGRMTLDGIGRLILTEGGRPVLDVDNNVITLDSSVKIEINESGMIFQNDQPVARLQVAAPTDPNSLRKVGHSLMRIDSDSNGSLAPARGTVLQGHVENSATDSIMTLTQMIAATKAVQTNSLLMQYHDNVIGQAINTFGRIT